MFQSFLKILTLSFLILFSVEAVQSQISYGGEPRSFGFSVQSEIPSFNLPLENKNLILSEDNTRDEYGEIYRVGVGVSTYIDILKDAVVDVIEGKNRIYRLKIKSEGAAAIGLYFSEFELPEGGELFVYNADHSKILGAYTFFNNPSSRMLAIEPVFGDEITVEYFEPFYARNEARLVIYEVGHMYRGYQNNIKGSEYNTSMSCEVDAVCSEANNWRPEQRSVAKILLKFGNNYGFCSGALVNNTNSDCFPFFLTADHCGEDASFDDMLQWIFYFKYERSTCNLSTEPEPSYISISGARKKASGANSPGSKSDFLLLQFNTYVPSTVEAYFSGFRTTSLASQSGVCIHHPAGDVKKISTYTSTITNYYNTHWSVGWATTSNGFGVTEGGSSGSPLYNSDGFIIGTLTGGLSACTNGGAGQGTGPTQKDIYGKMSYHWASNGTTPETRAKDWLDPLGTNPSLVYGRENDCSEWPVVADFYIPSNVIPVGTTVLFKNMSMFKPENFCTYLWEFEGVVQSATSTINSPTRTFNTEGVFEVKLTSTSAGVSATKTVTMYVGNVGIDETQSENFSLYPNPASGELNIELSALNQNEFVLMIYDLTGKLVHQEKISQGANSLKVNTEGYANGIYQIQLVGGEKHYSQKVSILH